VLNYFKVDDDDDDDDKSKDVPVLAMQAYGGSKS